MNEMTQREWRRLVRLKYKVKDNQFFQDGTAEAIIRRRQGLKLLATLIDPKGRYFLVFSAEYEEQ
jgi:hypothetical protein